VRYASHTGVPVDRSRNEIEQTLERYGADQFFYGRDGQKMMIGFRVAGRMVRIKLPEPSKKLTEQKQAQETRQRWRVLLLVIKAKLEAVGSGISTIEDEFFANLMLPNGSTMSEWAAPQLAEAYESGKMPKLLPSGGGHD